jgi:hypothetical protein
VKELEDVLAARDAGCNNMEARRKAEWERANEAEHEVNRLAEEVTDLKIRLRKSQKCGDCGYDPEHQ